jgi:phytoene desaturase
MKVVVIGAGFAGLASACFLAKAGHDVTILEKNSIAGGRARKFETEEGYVFDMGPSWYWMPDIFERFFAQFGKKTSDYYELVRLDPSYSVFFGEKEDVMQVPADMQALEAMFEQYEPGSTSNLRKFLAEAAYKYEVGIKEFVFKPSHNLWEFADIRILRSVFRLQLLQSMSSHVRKLFKNEKLLQLLEFPVLFLGATPQNTPALYSLMNYADMALGTWYPKGGMHKIIEGMVELAKELGVTIHLEKEVQAFEFEKDNIRNVVTQEGNYAADVVIGAADYHHIEQELLPKDKRHYDEQYWNKRVMAPSSLLFYLGVNKKLDKLEHHNLFFDEDFNQHAHEIYTDPQWPSKPLFYVCISSKTDPTAAPEGHENVFVLIPLAPDLEDTEALRETYYHMVMERLERLTGQSVRDAVVYKRSFAHRDFKADYHSYKGNAYGLANTLFQTAFLKPKLKSKKIKNLFYAGQLTTPGPGVPPSLISGEVAAKEVIKCSHLTPLKKI